MINHMYNVTFTIAVVLNSRFGCVISVSGSLVCHELVFSPLSQAWVISLVLLYIYFFKCPHL